MNKVILVVNQSTTWPRSLRRRGRAAEPVPGDVEVVVVLMTVPCAPMTGKKWNLFNSEEQDTAWSALDRAKSKLLVASLPLLVLAKVEMAANTCISQPKTVASFRSSTQL